MQASLSGRKLQVKLSGRNVDIGLSRRMVEVGYSGRKVDASLYNFNMPRFSRRDVRRILAAMAEIECRTCVQFRPRVQEASYVYILPER